MQKKKDTEGQTKTKFYENSPPLKSVRQTF